MITITDWPRKYCNQQKLYYLKWNQEKWNKHRHFEHSKSGYDFFKKKVRTISEQPFSDFPEPRFNSCLE